MAPPNPSVGHAPLPHWGPTDLAAHVTDQPIAILHGVTVGRRTATLVAWGPAQGVDSLEGAFAAAASRPLPWGIPPLLGAAVGALAWDGTPHFWMPAEAILFDEQGGRLWFRGEEAAAWARGSGSHLILRRADRAGAATGAHRGEHDRKDRRGSARPLWDRAAFCAAVREAQRQMADGTLEKVILSVPFQAPCASSPLTVFERLASRTTSGLRFLLDQPSDGWALVGASPEPLVALTGRRAELHLLAGTRPDAEGMPEALINSAKDYTEHSVAVEQSCRDLLTVCIPHSVSVEAFMVLERHPGLVHLASHLSGLLRDDRTPSDLIRSCFPAGTVGGVPRERAGRLIDRLEPRPRRWYAGAIGALLPNGDVQLWLTIRTLLLHNTTALVQTGAGLVLDSDPESEWLECVNKARPTLQAVDAEVMDD